MVDDLILLYGICRICGNHSTQCACTVVDVANYQRELRRRLSSIAIPAETLPVDEPPPRKPEPEEDHQGDDTCFWLMSKDHFYPYSSAPETLGRGISDIFGVDVDPEDLELTLKALKDIDQSSYIEAPLGFYYKGVGDWYTWYANGRLVLKQTGNDCFCPHCHHIRCLCWSEEVYPMCSCGGTIDQMCRAECESCRQSEPHCTCYEKRTRRVLFTIDRDNSVYAYTIADQFPIVTGWRKNWRFESCSISDLYYRLIPVPCNVCPPSKRLAQPTAWKPLSPSELSYIKEEMTSEAGLGYTCCKRIELKREGMDAYDISYCWRDLPLWVRRETPMAVQMP